MSTAETTTVVTGDLVAKARIVHERLAALYDAPIPFFSTKDPLSELVSAILSHRTRNHDSGCVYKALRAALPTWEAVRDAPTAEVEAAIDGVRWPEQKAPRIQQALREITARTGNLSLDFLQNLPVDEARAWLETMEGVGPKTSAATLLFSTLRMPRCLSTATIIAWPNGSASFPPPWDQDRPTLFSPPNSQPIGRHNRSTTITKYSCSTGNAAASTATQPATVARCWNSVLMANSSLPHK